jgi:5-methylcytosine-specific restriction endonuclease McrA
MRVWLARPRKPLRLDLTPGFARWCQKNRQRRRAFLSEYLKQWHISNPAASRVWNQSQPASQTTRRQAHRSALSNAPINDLGSDEWEWLVDIYEHRCAYCGRVDDHLTPDHILPLAMGGSNTLSNIAPACRACNTKKGARTPEQSQMNFAVVVDITHHLQQLGLM